MGNTSINERINTLVENFGNGKNTDFAELLGTSEANVRGYRTKVQPKSDFLQNIVRTFDISSEWLLTGEGNMMKEGCKCRKGIPLLPLSAMAGSFPGEQQVLECECERYVVPAFRGADFLIHVKGDSMEPHYKAGDIVACKIVPMDGLFFQWNHVYVIDTDQGPLIKRVKPSTEEGMITIISDNDRYEPFTIPLNRIYHIALVLGLIRLE